MSGKKNAVPSVPITTHIPLPEMTRLTSHLYSELEQRVPKGAYQEFFAARIREFLSYRHLDLAPFAGSPPGAFIVSGSPATIEALTRTLKGEIPL